MNFKTPLFDDTEPFAIYIYIYIHIYIYIYIIVAIVYILYCIRVLVRYVTPRLRFKGVFGMNFKTPLFDDTEPFGFDEGTILE